MGKKKDEVYWNTGESESICLGKIKSKRINSSDPHSNTIILMVVFFKRNKKPLTNTGLPTKNYTVMTTWNSFNMMMAELN